MVVAIKRKEGVKGSPGWAASHFVLSGWDSGMKLGLLPETTAEILNGLTLRLGLGFTVTIKGSCLLHLRRKGASFELIQPAFGSGVPRGLHVSSPMLMFLFNVFQYTVS